MEGLGYLRGVLCEQLGVGLLFYLYGEDEGVEFRVGERVWGVGENGRGRKGVGWESGKKEVGRLRIRERNGFAKKRQPARCVVGELERVLHCWCFSA